MNPIVLDAGNLLFKSSRAMTENRDKSLARAQMIWAATSAIGLDAFCPGSMDFLGGLKLLEGFRDQGKVPFLAANLSYPDGKPFGDKRYVVLERNGVRVGIFGLAGKSIFSERMDLMIDLKVGDPLEAARPIVRELEGKCDVMLLLSEMDKAEIERFCELFPQVKFVIAGNHVVGYSSRARRMDDTYVMQGISRGKSLSRLDLNVVNGNFDLRDSREYDVAKRSFERYDRDYKRIMEQTSGEDPEEFFENDQRKLARYRRVKESREKYTQMLEQLDPNQSNFAVGTINLGKSVTEDAMVQALIDAYELKWSSDYSTGGNTLGTKAPDPH
ncbi:MAG: hypothetical protein P9M14_12280 [Candidatus Alcyoniella australis]|nr:hypothetical protein [Candidatus Alcyoniella australis]